MSITFKTKDMLNVVASLNNLTPSKLLEITRYWYIQGYDGIITFTAYDGSNWVRYTLEADGEIDVIVKAEQFGKLVEKSTVENLTLTPKGEYLEVKGNGTYKVDMVAGDEDYPLFDDQLPEDLDDLEPTEVKSSLFYEIVNINDSAISRSNADGIYTGYLLDYDKAITTDVIRVCINPIEDIGTKMLISQPTMKLLASLTDEEAYVWVLGDYIYVTTSTVEIYGKLLEGVEDYQDMSVMDEQEFSAQVKLPTVEIQSILERLTLFMSPFDKAAARLVFGKNGLTIKTQSGSKEDVGYTEAKKVVEQECIINTLLLKEILSTVSEDYFSVDFGNELCLRIKSNGIVYYLATQEEQ